MKYLCTAPWTHTYVSPQGERRLCCASREESDFQKQYIDTGEQNLDGTFNPTSLNKTALTQVLITNSFIKITKPNKTSKVNFTTQNNLEFGLSYYINLLVSYYLVMYSKKSELEKIPIRLTTLVDDLRQIIQENSILDFTEIDKKSIQSFGEFDTKLIKLSSKIRLSKIIEAL